MRHGFQRRARGRLFVDAFQNQPLLGSPGTRCPNEALVGGGGEQRRLLDREHRQFAILRTERGSQVRSVGRVTARSRWGRRA